MLTLFLTATFIELVIVSQFGWKFRRIFGAIASLTLAFASSAILISDFNLLSLVIFSASSYRIVNLFRVVDGQIIGSRLKPRYNQTLFWLLVVQALSASLWWVTSHYDLSLSISAGFYAIAIIQVIAAVLIFIFSSKNVQMTKYKPSLKFYSDNELPTVSVAVPARNETANLHKCIDSIISNDYPKLEVLVLDDCSQDSTADVIKGYAQAGVRFLHGQEPNKSWLAKNQAYQQLLEAANGEFMLFCGADTQLSPHAIRSLVSHALDRKKSMICVLPIRENTSFMASIIQPLRFWWELALPRKLFNRPPVLSTCWLINRRDLIKLGGFKAVSRSIIPEGYFARHLIRTNSYSFVRTSFELRVATMKSFKDQLLRALRFRYPEVHRRIELVWLLTLLESLVLLGPFVMVFLGLVNLNLVIISLAVTSCLLLYLSQYLINRVSTAKVSALSVVNFPISVLVELIIANISMVQYEFSDVTWKDRNICIPVMNLKPQKRVRLSDLARG